MNNIHVLKRLLRYVAKYTGKLIILILIGLIGVAFEVAKPLPVKIVIDNVLAGQPLPEFLQSWTGIVGTGQQSQILLLCILVIVIITVCGAIITFVVSNLTVSLSQRLVYDLSVDLFSKLQRLSLTLLKTKLEISYSA